MIQWVLLLKKEKICVSTCHPQEVAHAQTTRTSAARTTTTDSIPSVLPYSSFNLKITFAFSVGMLGASCSELRESSRFSCCCMLCDEVSDAKERLLKKRRNKKKQKEVTPKEKEKRKQPGQQSTHFFSRPYRCENVGALYRSICNCSFDVCFVCRCNVNSPNFVCHIVLLLLYVNCSLQMRWWMWYGS